MNKPHICSGHTSLDVVMPFMCLLFLNCVMCMFSFWSEVSACRDILDYYILYPRCMKATGVFAVLLVVLLAGRYYNRLFY